MGKLVGAILGLIFLGIPGLILGIILGHKLDQRVNAKDFNKGFYADQIKNIQTIFFNTTFEVMGFIAKSDGRVSENEIKVARNIMSDMQLSKEQIQQAIQHFKLGKIPDFSLTQALDTLIMTCRNNRSLLQTFVEIQFRAAKADKLNYEKRNILETMCRRLGFSPTFSWDEFSGSSNYRQSQHQYHNRRPTYNRSNLAQAYATLELDSSATSEQVKKRYKKLMSQNHPDKLIAKGLPESMVKLATEKTQEIKAAYKLINKRSRN